jgi:predicted ATPase/tetratricopeptide (TPR) repeat protein/transcriptional regulator with XRE-family HTH domain
MLSAREGAVFAALLGRLRRDAGLTQEALAERAGLGTRSIQGLESGENTPRRETVRRLAAALALAEDERLSFEAAAETAPRRRGADDRHRAANRDRHRRAGLEQPIGVVRGLFRVVPAEGASGRSTERSPTNLPLQLTSFIGREREIAEVRRLLGTTRLLTVTGTGGAGKTRLVLEVAADLLGDYSDGVYLAEFAPLADPALVPQTVALALGVREVASQPMLTTLLAYLGPRNLLLVLDNCEHLLDGAAKLADTLLRNCPNLTIAATSREPLGMAGETSWRLPCLSLPDPSQPLSTEQLFGYESITLFVERASTARPGFELTERNATAVTRICARLDGMPLALELAAARVRVLSAEQLAERLDDRFHLLTGGSRTALSRQQTLRAAIDWSYDLLSEPEKVLFRRLSVFSGGWTLGAAEGVCAGDGLSAEEILDLLIKLVDRSVVAVVEEPSDEPRYRHLETIRQYAREKLREAGEEGVVRDRHRDWYAGMVERAEPELVGPREVEWLDRLEREYDNLRSVLEWCLVGEPRVGLRVAGSLWWFWGVRGYYTEGRRWLEDMLRLVPEPTALRAKALVGAGSLALYQADQTRGEAALAESLRISRQLGDDEGLARGLAELGMFTVNRSEYARACALLEEALAAAERAGQPVSSTPWVLNRMGVAAHLAGELGRARGILEEALALARQVKSERNLSWALGDLGELLASLGEYADARTLLEEGLAISRAIDDRQGLPWRLLQLGNLLRVQNEHGRARELLDEALARFRNPACDHGVVLALATLANLERSEGRYEQAHCLLQASVDPGLEVQDQRTLSHRVWLWGVLDVERGAHARGTRLIGAGAARGLYRTKLCPIDEAEAASALERARSALGEEAFARVWAEGEAMTLAQAVAAALEVPPQVRPIDAAGPTDAMGSRIDQGHGREST